MMTLSTLLPGQWTLTLGALCLISSMIFLLINKRQRHAVLVQLKFRRRRASGASTPPRSFSPSRKGSVTPPSGKESSVSTSSSPDYANTFPPSRRSVIPDLIPLVSPKCAKVLLGSQASVDCVPENALPTTKSYDPEGEELRYTPTGFSTEEVKALGDFPPYDVLSGVPLPEPNADFDHNTALPRPYRPFRWSYHQTMSLTKMEPDWWLELESTYAARIKERQGLFKAHGSDVLAYLPGSEIACKELMEMCLQFYCARYPALFSLSSDKKTFQNNILHTTTDLKTTHPLHVLLRNIPEDFAIVLRNEEDGLYYFRAGVICSALGWNVATKLGMQLRQIHQPIPDYKEKMAFSMDRYFSKMPTNSPIQRGSWGLEIGQPLYMPPGHPHEKFRESQNPDLKIEDCSLRVDWQTLRRLPLSGAIVFNFKAVFTPIQEFRDEPFVPSLVLKVLKEGKKNLMGYKGTWHVEHVVVPALEAYEEEQYEKGLVKGEGGERWVVETLRESPYFPGWEEKWKRQQGF